MTHDTRTTTAAGRLRGQIVAAANGGRPDARLKRNGQIPARRAGRDLDDYTACQCQAWLRHQAEACKLSLEWGQVEARLQAEHGWYKMSAEARAAHPGQVELDAIQARLEALDTLRDRLLPTLAELPATERNVIALKLSVAAELVDAADFPEAHALIVRARDEMLAL